MLRRVPFLLLLLVVPAYPQGDPSSAVLQQILQRLDRLEKQNRELMQEVTALRQQLAAAQGKPAATSAEAPKPPSLRQEVAVNKARIAEQAQTKVEAAHKYPIKLTGLVLFNAFSNTESRNGDAVSDQGLLGDSYGDGATMRQTLLGFKFHGPALPGDGHVDGSLTMDFWGGGAVTGSNWIRLRRAEVSLNWRNRSFMVGQDKPLISPYNPDSLAEVGVPPLAGAGNFWFWLPQARYEERIRLGKSWGINGQVAMLQTGGMAYRSTEESYGYVEPVKPALEGRIAIWHRFDDDRRFELAPGFHISSDHIGGASVGSRIASLDWLIDPGFHLKITGTVFTGRNVAGLGSLGNGIVIGADGIARAVHSSGGWTQVAVPVTSRLTWNIFSGLEEDSDAEPSYSTVIRNWSYASNLIYHLSSNVVIGLEGLQMRTRSGLEIPGVQNRYDLAVGYLF
jgi:hypothetical protein